jgi:signal transduction histidine kinase
MKETLKLNEAFYNFTKASKSLETYYGHLSEKVQYLTSELEKKNARLREMEEHHRRNHRLIAMGEMAAKIVHEIRSPLCSIELFSNMLSNDLEGTGHAEMAKGISTGIKSLNNILSNMLFFAKPQKPSFRDVKLRDVICETTEILTPLMVNRGIKLESSVSEENLVADSELMKQVFMNIFLNAIQAMPEGGTIKISTKDRDGYLSVEVADEGVGLGDTDMEGIFDPFFSTKEKGTGLGLSIAHKIMQSHNGYIRARRNNGKGSTFCLYFPASEMVGKRRSLKYCTR